MEDVVILPSPNWFAAQCFCISPDGWLIYGSGKSICVTNLCKTAGSADISKGVVKVINGAHTERVTCVAPLTSWCISRMLISASGDGMVKLWNVDQKTVEKAHNYHQYLKDSVVAISCTDADTVISLGSSSSIVVWNIIVNRTKELKLLTNKNAKPTCMQCCPFKPSILAVGLANGSIYLVSWKDNHVIAILKGHDTEIKTINWCPVDDTSISSRRVIHAKKKRFNSVKNVADDSQVEQSINPNDSVNQSVNQSINKSVNQSVNQSVDQSNLTVTSIDDTFDIYEDFEEEEFGHTKYKPEIIVAKDEKKAVETDFLKDCESLKVDILSRKNDLDDSIDSKDEQDDSDVSTGTIDEPQRDDVVKDAEIKLSKMTILDNEEKGEMLFAAIDQHGKTTIWSTSGRMLASGICSGNEARKFKKPWATLNWMTQNQLAGTDHSGQIFSCNITEIEHNKLKWKPLHYSHTKFVFGLTSTTASNCEKSTHLWSTSQDRRILCYSLEENKIVKDYTCIGGCVTCMVSSDMDPMKIAVGGSDGSILIWNMNPDKKDRVDWGNITTYWQGIQSKVVRLDWHPTKENLLAFSTIEGRVGLLNPNASKVIEILPPAFIKAVYGLEWGNDKSLFACGNFSWKVYNTADIRKEPKILQVNVGDEMLKITTFHIGEKYFTIGTATGAVALLNLEPPHEVLTILHPCSKEIIRLTWHPKGVTTEEGDSPYANMLAIASSPMKVFTILKLTEDDSIKMEKVCNLEGHVAKINHIAWSPHYNCRILSTSEDTTIHIWDVLTETIISTYSVHGENVSAAIWCPSPDFPNLVLSSGVDLTVRVWDITANPPNTSSCMKATQKRKIKLARTAELERHNMTTHQSTPIKISSKKLKDRPIRHGAETDNVNGNQTTETEGVLATFHRSDKRKKRFLMGIQHCFGTVEGCKHMLKEYLKKNPNPKLDPEDINIKSDDGNMDHFKILGDRDDVLELLEKEQTNHLEFSRYEQWIGVGVLKSEFDIVLKDALEKGKLDPFLISLAPSVSHRFWKEAISAYGSQATESNYEFCCVIVKRALAKLAIQDVEGAVECFVNYGLHFEAIALARVRYMDDLADSVILKWAGHLGKSSSLKAVELFLSIGQLEEALRYLRKMEPNETKLLYQLATTTGSDLLAAELLDKLNTNDN